MPSDEPSRHYNWRLKSLAKLKLAFIARIFEKKGVVAMAKTIGKLIEEEVRKQGWVIKDFAEKICCTRTNVYDIFARSKMDVSQLELISRVLKHNFISVH